MTAANFTLMSHLPDSGEAYIRSEMSGDDTIILYVRRHGVDLTVFLDLGEARDLRHQLGVLLYGAVSP